MSAIATASPPAARPRWYSVGRFTAVLSLLGLVTLCYVGGAAAMYFGLPSSGYLALAFEGGRDLLTARPDATVDGDLSGARLSSYQPGEAYDGYTLYTTTQGAEATLLDMKGDVVRRWTMPRTASWPPVGVVPPDKPLHWERCYLYPNGDLLALTCSGGDVPYGCGVVKVDKDSKFVWGYKGNVHHDLDVGDDGRVYVLTQQAPPAGWSGQEREIAVPEQIAILSAEGREQAVISLQEAFAKSPYALLLQPPDEEGTDGPLRPNLPGLRPPGAPLPPVRPRRPAPPEDVLHSNSVKVLSAALAPKFPLFQAGQILISLRNPSVLAVVDPTTHAVVWAAKGPWVNQHDAEFLANGHLLLFDNRGGGRSARVLEYDPQTQALPWSSGGQGGLVVPGAIYRGTSQRLLNGDTLVVEPVRCRIVEVKSDKEVVWEWGLPSLPSSNIGDNALNMTGARRFGAAELPFLKGK